MSEQELHAVVGSGPVGRAIVAELSGRGLGVRLVARHRSADLPAGVDFVEADITDPESARRALAGAAVVYHAASAPYHRWPELLPPIMEGIIAGATAGGARIVYADNLYACGPHDGPLTEDLPSQATGPNGRVRARLAERLMQAGSGGAVRAAIGRASDYYGPGGLQSTAGERLFGPALAGKKVQVLGDPDAPHTLTYLGDFARGLVTLGMHDAAFGQVWHVPSAETITTRAFVRLVFDAAGQPMNLGAVPSPILGLLALFDPTMRAVKEQQYQREAPWVVDHSKFGDAFGVEVTPHADAIARTVEWWRNSGSGRS
jgi:nucleoside-diphosphate-sugar epimerase